MSLTRHYHVDCVMNYFENRLKTPKWDSKESWGLRLLGIEIGDPTFGIHQLIIADVKREYDRREADVQKGYAWREWKYVLPVFLSR